MNRAKGTGARRRRVLHCQAWLPFSAVSPSSHLTCRSRPGTRRQRCRLTQAVLIRRLVVMDSASHNALVIVYHRTPAGDAILEEGFRDGHGGYGLPGELGGGVFVSNLPADINEGAKGKDLLRIDIDADVLTQYEIIDAAGHSSFREWFIPAAILNREGVVTRVVDEDAELDAPHIAAILGRR